MSTFPEFSKTISNSNQNTDDAVANHVIVLDEPAIHNANLEASKIRNIVTPIFNNYKKTILSVKSDKGVFDNTHILAATHDMNSFDNSKSVCLVNEDESTKIVIQKGNYAAVYSKEYHNESVRCSICKKYFSDQDILEQHKKNHSRIRNLKCDICSKTFARWDYFNRHLKSHSTNESFVCNLCGKAFACLDHQKMHMRTHARNGYIKCEFCEETFTHMDQYKKHLKIHESLPIPCNYCNETFMHLQDLRQHMRMNHSSEQNFKCNECGQAFTRSYHLEGHMRTVHNGEHPFKCNACNKIFTRLSHMQVHVCTPTEPIQYSMLELSNM